MLNSIAHWLFSVEYFRLALKFPLIVGMLENQEFERRLSRNKWILIGANLLFYALVAAWGTACIFYFPNVRMLMDASAGIAAMPAIVLIFSITRLRKQIKRLNSVEIRAREWLMSIHTGIFTFYIVTSLANHLMIYLSNRMGEDLTNQAAVCRYTCAAQSFMITECLTNSAILALFTYMSVKFSQPVQGRWQQEVSRRYSLLQQHDSQTTQSTTTSSREHRRSDLATNTEM